MGPAPSILRETERSGIHGKRSLPTVVVVKSPDPKWFEQAIFLLREEAGAEDAPEEQVLKRAQEVADAYLLRTSPQGKRRRIWIPAVSALAGGGVASVIWLFATGVFPLPF